MTRERHALVVGAGIVGLTTAVRLALEEWRVTVFDPTPAHGATWAAAGMLAPAAELVPGERAAFERQCRAIDEWRELISSMERWVGRRIEVVQTGTLLCGWDAGDRAQVEQFVSVAREYGALVRRVVRDDDETIFEHLSPRVRSGYLLEGDGWLDPDAAVELLTATLRRLGGSIVSEQVVSVATHADVVTAVTAEGAYRGDVGVLATGAHALPRGVEAEHAVRPIRGITCRVVGLDRSAEPTFRALIRGRAFYAVSRPGGYCVLGASAEERSYSRVEVGEVAHLLRDAIELIPELEGTELDEIRYGLRPVSSTLDPFVEVLSGGRWIWSSGHYRHGVTMAPLAAREVLEVLETIVSRA